MNKLFALAGTVVLATTAAVGGAQMMGDSGAGMGSGDPIVAPDGTALVVRPTFASQTGTANGKELVAITAAGTVAWRETLGFGVHDLALAGNLVVVTQAAGIGYGGTAGTLPAATSRITALQLASGVEAWSTALQGIAMSATAAGDRIYVKVVQPSTAGTSQTGGTGGMHGGSGGMGGNGGSGGMHGGNGGTNGGNGSMNGGMGLNGTFSLVAVGLDGEILWSLPLAE